MDSDTDSFHSASDGENEEESDHLVSSKFVQPPPNVPKPQEEPETTSAEMTLESPSVPISTKQNDEKNNLKEEHPSKSEDAVTPPSSTVVEETAVEKAVDDEATGWDVEDWDEDELKTPDQELPPPKSTVRPSQTTAKTAHRHHHCASAKEKKSDENDWFDNQLSSNSAHSADVSDKRDRPNSLWEWGLVQRDREGFSTVLESVETGLGAPTPEALAKLSVAEKEELSKKVEMLKEPWPATDHDDCDSATDEALSDVGSEIGGIPNEDQCSSGYQSDSRSRDLDPAQALSSLTGGGSASGFSGLFSGVGKSLVSGSLDVLESLGKKTFETLTVSEQGAKGKPGKRRLIFQKERPNLSKVIRELKAQGEADAKSRQEEEEARHSNFAFLFEKNEGMVHLEGLEMLSDSCSRQVESALISGIDQDTLDQLDEVRDLYEELTDEESLSEPNDVAFEGDVKKYLKCIGLAYNPARLIETDKRLFDWLYDCQTTQDLGEMKHPRDLHRQGIQSLAEFTARCVETLHKLAQLILVAGSAPEAKPFFDLTLVFCSEIGMLSAKFSTCLNSSADDVDDPHMVNSYLTGLFLEANNSTNYLREALRLLRPVLERAIIHERNTSVA